jgi:hypothetical protein
MDRNRSGYQVHGSTVQGLKEKAFDLHAFPTAEPGT